ncbi:MAG: type II toxin-antitoxin system Phd/YefM family antitoxin [Candidatus Binataceae bacterium]
MKNITAAELARNLREVLDRLAANGEDLVIERNNRQVARLIPGPGRMTALEAMVDIYRTLPERAAATWEAGIRAGRLKHDRLPRGVRDPWAS